MKLKKTEENGYDSPFASRLRDIMRDTSTTQVQLANYIGVTRQAVGQWQNGNTAPDIIDLGKMADFFNVSTDYLLGRTEAKPIDNKLQAACDYTGLSEQAIETLSILSGKSGGSFLDGRTSLSASKNSLDDLSRKGITDFLVEIAFPEFIMNINSIIAEIKKADCNIDIVRLNVYRSSDFYKSVLLVIAEAADFEFNLNDPKLTRKAPFGFYYYFSDKEGAPDNGNHNPT